MSVIVGEGDLGLFYIFFKENFWPFNFEMNPVPRELYIFLISLLLLFYLCSFLSYLTS